MFFLLRLDAYLKRLMKYLQSLCFITQMHLGALRRASLSLGAFQTQCYQWFSSPRAYAFCAFSMYKELNWSKLDCHLSHNVKVTFVQCRYTVLICKAPNTFTPFVVFIVTYTFGERYERGAWRFQSATSTNCQHDTIHQHE
jgi:hypothetical protein